jgi:hypothetical protein
MKNSGFSAKSKVSAFNKSQCQTESEVLLNPLLLIHATRYGVLLPKFEFIFFLTYSNF